MNRGDWTAVFAAIPEPAFFEIVRHYLGPVRTPYHKPDLIARLTEFFGRRDVIRRVRDFLGDEDARILTIVAYHDEPSTDIVGALLPDVRPTALNDALLNLEERLLIWRKADGSAADYALTPLGSALADEGCLGAAAILGSGRNVESAKPSAAWMTEAFLTAVLGFLQERIPLFKKEGGWRKKSLEILEDRFPVLFRDGRGEDRVLLTGRALLAAGLAARVDDGLEPRLEAWKYLEARSEADRGIVMKTRAAAGRSLPLTRGIGAIRLLTEILPVNRAYEPADLAALLRLAVGGSSPPSPRGARHIVDHLVLMGELQVDGNGSVYRPERFFATDESPVHISPMGDVSLAPGAPLFGDLALCAVPTSVDVLADFRLEKARYIAGLDAGVDPEIFRSELERRSAHGLPPNIVTLLDEWETEHRSIHLVLGALLTVEGHHREVVESTGILEPFAISHPGPGVWILDPFRQNQWRRALEGVGIDRIPLLTSLRSDSDEDEAAILTWEPGLPIPEIAAGAWAPVQSVDLGPIKEALERRARSIPLSDEEMAVFTERLDRRLVLVDDQIRRGAWRREVMTAKGLDYRGKIRLADAALSGRGDRLEASIASGRDVERITLIPRSIDKDGDEHILVGLSVPEEQVVRLRIRKIGFLRRVQTSLF